MTDELDIEPTELLIDTFVVEWVEALESDRYKKGKGALRDNDDRMCCLGVACDILPEVNWKDTGPFDWIATYGGDYSASRLPRSLQRHLGLSNGTMESLISLNDTNDTFEPIVKYLRAYYPASFEPAV